MKTSIEQMLKRVEQIGFEKTHDECKDAVKTVTVLNIAERFCANGDIKRLAVSEISFLRARNDQQPQGRAGYQVVLKNRIVDRFGNRYTVDEIYISWRQVGGSQLRDDRRFNVPYGGEARFDLGPCPPGAAWVALILVGGLRKYFPEQGLHTPDGDCIDTYTMGGGQ